MPAPLDRREVGTGGGAFFTPSVDAPHLRQYGGLERAHNIFLGGCGLPTAWSGQAQWRILEIGFGLGLNFLATWATWKADPLRPKQLHFVSTEPYLANSEGMHGGSSSHDVLHQLNRQLQAQLWGLLPGFHRLVFEGGQVLLTLCIGEVKTMLRQQQFEADSVYLDGFGTSKKTVTWDIHTLKAVARCCRRGTRIASWILENSVPDAFSQCGFIVHTAPDLQAKHDNLQGLYDPSWTPKKAVYPDRFPSLQPMRRLPSTAVIVGAGLAGAAVANSLARRGWQVLVLDAACTPASGASGLPAGLLVPHISPDDSLLSRLSRSGVRITLQQADELLLHGVDWNRTGVLEHDLDGETDAARSLSRPLTGTAADWHRTATPAQLAVAGLATTSKALWHRSAGWIKPSRLVNAWLDLPSIAWRGNAQVARLQPCPQGWKVMDAAGGLLAQADLVVLAAAYGSQTLAATVNPTPWALQAVRGQVSWGVHAAQHVSLSKDHMNGLPNFPVNGHGGLIPTFPGPDGSTWLMGASYERGNSTPVVKYQDHEQNLERLRRLLPTAADLLAEQFNEGVVQSWAGIRCATASRLPTLGRIATTSSGSEVWVCTGMGSRGLTFAGLCAELLAAQLHGEPLPLERRLALALTVGLPVASYA